MKPKNLAKPYLLFTMLITWILWWGIVVLKPEYGTPIMMVPFVIGGNATAIVAIVLLLKSKQFTVKGLLKNIFDVAQSVKFYVLVLVGLIVYSGIPLITGRSTIYAPFYAALIAFPINLILGGGLEELGWRWLLQPALEKKMNFTFASLLTGIIWSLWHLPLFFMQGAAQSEMNFLIFAINVIGLAFFLAAIYRASGSIWLCILFHGAWNSLTEIIRLSEDYLSTIATALVMIIIACVVVHISNKKAEGYDKDDVMFPTN
jgi:membrane protease YdiL (CAAX protease family)